MKLVLELLKIGFSGEFNDNIIDFRYYPEKGNIEFEAMHNGEWSIFQLPMDGKEAIYIKRAEDIKTDNDYRIINLDVDYINLEANDFHIYEKNDSVFISSEGRDKCILRYRGFLKSDISGASGYKAQGLSPDGKFLIYGTTGRTGLGFFFGNYKRYIINLETREYAEYVNSQSIQWVKK